jgi:SnoaL-like domain
MDTLPPTVSAFILAYNSIDVAGMLRCLAPGIHFMHYEKDALTVETRGIEEFEKLARQSATAFSERSQTVHNCIARGNFVATEVGFRGRAAIDFPNGWRAGDSIELPGASFFTLQSNLIATLVDVS